MSISVVRNAGIGLVTALGFDHWLLVVSIVGMVSLLHLIVDRLTMLWLLREADRSTLSGQDVAGIVSAAYARVHRRKGGGGDSRPDR